MTIVAQGGRCRSCARADALLVNLGMFDVERQKAALAAIPVANKLRKPWVLDPVFIDRSPPRAAFAKRLVAKKPTRAAAERARIGRAVGGKAEDLGSVHAPCRQDANRDRPDRRA